MAHIGSWGDWSPAGRGMLTDVIVELAHSAVGNGIEKLIMTLDWCLFTQTNPRRLLPEAQAVQYLTDFATRLTNEGLAGHVHGWYTIDEPNISEIGLSAADIATANNLIRATLDGQLPLLCIYGNEGRYGAYPGIASYDWVGFDNYGAPIFSNGEYDNLVRQLSPMQHTIIVPGGASPWREDPRPFYDHAQTDGRVALIMPFKWFGTDGIAVNGMAPPYRAVGKLIKAAQP
jgi:hypothetical protein